MSLKVYTITRECLDRDYRGCGKAWAAVRDNQVLAIRYMAPDGHRANLPKWVEAVDRNSEGLDGRMLPTAWSSRGLAKLARAAGAAGDCPVRPKGGQYRPRDLLMMARNAIANSDRVLFQRHRERCREELAAIGDVVSGMCSCTEFVVA